MKNENIIICFCKQPVVGQVKSRLAEDIGNKKATEIYKCLLTNTLKEIFKTSIKAYLYCSPNANHSDLIALGETYALHLRDQCEGDLGMKMYHALNNHLNNHNHVALVGTDCLEIDHKYLKQAFEMLHDDNDLVLGPSKDGGYVLIGANKIDQELFTNIDWGTDLVLEQTRKKIAQLDFKVEYLTTVRDIDTAEDYQYFSSQDNFRHLFRLD